MTDLNTFTSENQSDTVPTHSGLNPAEILELEGKVKSGADWFLWIGILSLINSIVYLGLNDTWTFVIGLGFSQLVDAIATYYGGNAKFLALGIDMVVISIFGLFYWFARKHRNWAFIAGTIFYVADTILVAFAGDYLSTGFHIFALYWIVMGYRANRKLIHQS